MTREGRLLSVGPGGLTPHLLGSEGPVWPQGVAAVFGREVVGLGPLDGRVLWRQPIQAGVWRLLGDGPVVLAAALDERPERAKSDARIARGFRRADGLEVAVGLAAWKDSDPVWEGRLLQWTVANGGWRLVLRDLPAGREAWTHPVELGWVLDSDVPTQYGLLGLDGTLTVFDLRAGRQVLRAAVPPDHMKGMRSGTLLADADGWVLVLDRQRNPGEAQAGGAASELVPGSLRPLLVNGTILAFDRRGRLRWEVAAAEQCLLREHLAELPVLLLVRPLARDTERPREPPGALVTSFDKATGRPVLRDHAVPGMGRLRAVWVDDRTGTVDLVGGRKTLRHRAVD